MEILIILILVIAIIFIKVENYRKRCIDEEELMAEVRECLKKELQNIDTGEPHNYFSEAVIMWFKDFKENNKQYVLGQYTMYNNSSEEARNNTQIWASSSKNDRYFYSTNKHIDKKRNKKLTFADVILLQKCKEFLEIRDELFNRNLNFNKMEKIK